MMEKPGPALLSLLLLLSFPPAASAEEGAVIFSGLPYPIEAKLPAGQKDGSLLFETPFSEPPPSGYDTVLVQGQMPDPGIKIELVVKSRFFFTASARYQSERFHRFPNGRFWTRYRIPLTLQPLKLSVINLGIKAASSITIYETELQRAAESKEEIPPRAVAPYVPDPELFVPLTAPIKLIRRADWQAAPPTAPYTPHTPKYFTLHHTQAHYPATHTEATAEMQFIQDFHQNGRGWIDIAYHFLIDPAGNIFEGRPIKVLGAHVKSNNTANIGISLMGSFHPPAHNVFTPAAQDSFVAVGRYLKDTYEVPVSSFYAHRDLRKTDCPGDDLYAKKELLRGLIFTPQTPDLPGVPPDAARPATPRLQSLRQLMQYLDKR